MDSGLLADAGKLLLIIWTNIVLSGDNAVVIALAAAGLPAEQRARAITFGIAAAAILRIVFSFFAVYLLHVVGLKLVGGLLLCYITWGFYTELRAGEHAEEEEQAGREDHAEPKSMARALMQITLADVSMSLDNVLAIAALARDNFVLLAVGLLFSVVLMGLAASFIARLLDRYRWIAWVGMLILAWVSFHLTWEGFWEVMEHMGWAHAPISI